jgi:hypothetical protein
VTGQSDCDTQTPDGRVPNQAVAPRAHRLKTRTRLEAENIVLRQQVIVLSRKARSRARLWNIDRLIFVWLYGLFPSILNAITVVKSETVIRWHRLGFRAYWRWKSRRRGGRPKIDREIRDLIRRMSRENPLWGAPRIHGELLMLGIDVAESTVARTAEVHIELYRIQCRILATVNRADPCVTSRGGGQTREGLTDRRITV